MKCCGCNFFWYFHGRLRSTPLISDGRLERHMTRKVPCVMCFIQKNRLYDNSESSHVLQSTGTKDAGWRIVVRWKRGYLYEWGSKGYHPRGCIPGCQSIPVSSRHPVHARVVTFLSITSPICVRWHVRLLPRSPIPFILDASWDFTRLSLKAPWCTLVVGMLSMLGQISGFSEQRNYMSLLWVPVHGRKGAVPLLERAWSSNRYRYRYWHVIVILLVMIRGAFSVSVIEYIWYPWCSECGPRVAKKPQQCALRCSRMVIKSTLAKRIDYSRMISCGRLLMSDQSPQ